MHTNHLIHEKSPYLLQHAHNSVNWYPWCEEAFVKAKQENKPIFLSIGYSTCHWCHVMEQESFEDEEVAEVLNRYFIAIKVDREERPDVDAIYMAACQLFTGQGGWPLTVLMTPEQKPFFAGTYFPKEDRYGMMGLVSLLRLTAQKWAEEPQVLSESGEEVTRLLREQTAPPSGQASPLLLEQAYRQFCGRFDRKHGGFGRAPKFPTPHHLLFLLRFAHHSGERQALDMVELTLEQMYRGGIYDHIGYGFSRYSTDDFWLVPHFEKMLYDNALLLLVYLEAYQITGRALYRMVAEQIIDYVRRELTDEQGGFYCAQDADSEGVEGKYYVFTPQEVRKVLGETDGKTFNQLFAITESGNFGGKSIPNLLHADALPEENAEMRQWKQALLAYRKKRAALHTDDKILTSWNALMIAGLAKAAVVLENPDYLKQAHRAMRFIEEHLMKDGRLSVRWRDGERAGNGHLDDYAFLIWAYLSLYQADFQAESLVRAGQWADRMVEQFWDAENGGFFLSSAEGERLIHRPKEVYDGAIPSGNSVAAYDLVLLARLTGEERYRSRSEKQLDFLAGSMQEYPMGYGFALTALQLAVAPSQELVCVVEKPSEVEAIRKELNGVYLPAMAVLVKCGDALDQAAPFTQNYELKDGRTTFYWCQNHVCAAPVHQLSDILQNESFCS